MKYPKVNTIQLIKEILKKEGIEVSPVLIECIKEEVNQYQKLTVEDIPPYPKEILSASTYDEKGKKEGIIILFENPFRYIEIVDEKGEKVSADDLKMIEIVDRLGLWINKNDSFDVELVLIDNHTFSEIKRIPIEEIFIDYPIF